MRRTTAFLQLAAVLFLLFPLAACSGGERRARYELRAEYVPAERRLCAELQVSVPNSSQEVWEEIPFMLWPNAYREGAAHRPVSSLLSPAVYYDGASYGGISVSGGTGAEFSLGGEDETILFARLSEPLYPGESATLSVAFETTLPKARHRFGAGEETVNLAHFYPVLCAFRGDGFCEYVCAENGDPFVSECADYEVTLTLPASYFAAFTGTGTRTVEGEKAVYRVTAENVRDVAFVLSERFTLHTRALGGVTVEYYALLDEAPERALSAACESLAFYGETFGQYPYPRYVVVQTELAHDGMEYPALSMISSSLGGEAQIGAIVHETAHQWWYAAVGSDQFMHAWQDEGLAELSSALFFEAHPAYGRSYDEAVRRAERAYRAYYSVRSQLGGADTSMDRPLTSFSGEYEYCSIACDKALILFDRLRSVAGDRRFFKALRAYYGQNAGSIASPAHLIAAMEGAGVRAEELFRSFTEGLCVI